MRTEKEIREELEKYKKIKNDIGIFAPEFTLVSGVIAALE